MRIFSAEAIVTPEKTTIPTASGKTLCTVAFICRPPPSAFLPLNVSAPSRRLPLDGDVHEASILRPRAVVIPHLGIPQEVLQHEPGVRGALADPAIGNDVLVRADAPPLVELLQIIRALEGPVLLHRLAPWDVRRAGDVPAALGPFLREVLGGKDLSRELFRGADVYERLSLLAHRSEDGFPFHPDALVRILRLVARRRIFRCLLGQGASLGDPFGPAPVHDPGVRMAVVLQEPERVGGEPVVVVAVQ